MPKAIRIHRTGGPEVLTWDTVSVPAPGPGEIHVRNHYVGLNYIDTYHRSGLYPLPLPSPIGMEGAGEVVTVGEGVTAFKPGDAVAYGAGPVGAYAEEWIMPWHRAVHRPTNIDAQIAAGMMLQGMTVRYLLKVTYPVAAGQTILFHAAAGGVGLIACQWARYLGVKLIGTAGTDEKCTLAEAHGAWKCINYNTEDFADRVRELTDGQGVPVVYDSVGASTWDKSLNCLSPRGLLVSFGNASGPVPPVNLGVLAAKGSLYVTRPTLMTYVAERSDLEATAADLFSIVESGAVQININHVYPLAEAAQAHHDLEERKTTGSAVFKV